MTKVPFKIGDKITVLKDFVDDHEGNDFVKGDVFTVKEIDSSDIPLFIENEDECWWVSQCDIKNFALISSQTPMSNIVEFYKAKRLTADDRALIKAGVLSQCGELTETGKDFLYTLLLADKKAEMAKLSKEMLDELAKPAKK